MTQPLRILVVEDDPDVLAAIAAILRDEDGFAVWVARDGEQAMEVADELGFDADVLVVDLNLGPGMRGDQLVREYRLKSRRPFRLVVVSGTPATHSIGRKLRASAIIEKPYEADQLVRMIRTLTSAGQITAAGS